MEQPAWAWAIFGLVLLTLELLSVSFFFMWFGIAALCVALILVVFPLPLAAQLFSFAVLSVATLLLGRRRFVRSQPELRIGQAQDETIGKIGRLTAEVSADQKGMIAFTVPVMGSREWVAIADESIASGAQAEVVAIVGNYLRVRSITSTSNQP